MADSKKKSGTKAVAAPKKVAAVPAGPVDQKQVVSVRNKTAGIINTSQGQIEAGETGKATIRELQSLNHFLEKA